MSSPSLRATALAFSYETVPVFEYLDLHLTPGWTGVVGGNGAGKTTLLSLLAGEMSPTAGTVRSDPARLVVARCPQRVTGRTAAIDAFAWDWSGAAIRLRDQLQLDPEALDRWTTLSPGERKRWQIGAALIARPDLLLLDEPTNHLDAAGRALLVDALRRFNGIGLLVSHDRALLDALTIRTVRLAHGTGDCIEAPYSQAREQWALQRAAHAAEHAAVDAARRRARRRLADERRSRQQADAARSSRHRMTSHKDSDARSAGAKKRASDAEAKIGQRVGVARRNHAALDARLATLGRPEKQLGRALAVDQVGERRRVLARFEGALTVGDRQLLAPAQVVVERGSRVWLKGANGAGKTTLLRALMDAATVPADRVMYLSQDPDGQAWRARLLALDRDARAEVLNGVAALGVDPDRLLRTTRPSPGETQKLALAFGLTRPIAWLALDEPTNHLDLPAIERLEAALAGWGGALTLITHDAALAQACTTTTWQLVEGALRVDATRTRAAKAHSS